MFSNARSSFLLLVAFTTVLVHAAPHSSQVNSPAEPEHPSWLGPSVEEGLTDADQNVFDSKLEISLSDKIPNIDGANHRGCYTNVAAYDSHGPGKLFIKVVNKVTPPQRPPAPKSKPTVKFKATPQKGPKGKKKVTAPTSALSEVKALKVLGNAPSSRISTFIPSLVASGLQIVPKISKVNPVPVVVLLKHDGSILFYSPHYGSLSPQKKQGLRNEALDTMCQGVAMIAMEKHLYHADNNINNALFEFDSAGKITAVRIIDWEGNAVFHVVGNPTLEEIKDYCKKQAIAQTDPPSGWAGKLP